MTWTTTELLAAIRQRGRIPDEDTDYTDARLLLEADWQMRELLTPIVMTTRSEFYMRTETFPIVRDEANYPIPSRCIASVPRMVYYLERNGRTYELPWVPLVDKLRFEGRQGSPLHHAIQDDLIVLLPPPSTTTGTLVVEYEYRAGKLVPVAEATLATAVDQGLFKVTGAVPAGWTTADKFDLIKGTSPFVLLAGDLTADTVTTGPGGEVAFAAGDLPARFEEGDFVCLAEQSAVPQIPANGHPVLAMAVAKEVLEEMGDPHAQVLKIKLGEALGRFRGQLTPREKGIQQKITSPNSALRRHRRRRWHYGAPT